MVSLSIRQSLINYQHPFSSSQSCLTMKKRMVKQLPFYVFFFPSYLACTGSGRSRKRAHHLIIPHFTNETTPVSKQGAILGLNIRNYGDLLRKWFCTFVVIICKSINFVIFSHAANRSTYSINKSTCLQWTYQLKRIGLFATMEDCEK